MKKVILFCSILLLLNSCTMYKTANLERKMVPVEDIETIDSKYLKVHMKSGKLYVLKEWEIVDSTEIEALGIRYGINRDKEKKKLIATKSDRSKFFIDLDDIALLEVNTVEGQSQSKRALKTLTIVTASLTALFYGIIIIANI